MQDRIGTQSRKTAEVDIEVEIRLDQPGYEISITTDKEEPGLPFGILALFEHLFAQIFRHGRMGGRIKAHGDLPHHLLEDLGVCWGQALAQALGERKGIERFYSLGVPLDGSRAYVEIDLSGRFWANLNFNGIQDQQLAGLFQHVFEWIALHGAFNIYGFTEGITLQSAHHQLEAFAKAFGKTLYCATRITDPAMEVPSTKGVL